MPRARGARASASVGRLAWLQPQLSAETDSESEAQIISGHLLEDRGIYLTLAWNDGEPRLYVLPWSQKTAQQLIEALDEAEQNGTQAMVKMPLQKIAQNDAQDGKRHGFGNE